MTSPAELCERAERALAEKDVSSALLSADAAIALAASAHAHNLRGRALAALGRHGEAREAFRSAVALDPSFDRGWTNLAKLEADAGHAGAAADLIEAGLVHAPDSPRLLRALANAHLRAGSLAAALAPLERLCASDDASSADLRSLGTVLLAAGRSRPAADALVRAALAHPADQDLIGQACAAAHAAGATDAMGVLIRAAAAVVGAAPELTRLAMRAGDAGDWALAEDVARRALSADPASAEAVVFLAQAMTAQGRDAEAERLLDDRGGHGGGPEAWLELTRRLRERNQPEQAAQVLGRARLRYPSSAAVYAASSKDLWQRALYVSALEDIERAAALAPDDAEVRAQFANALVIFREHSAARLHFRAGLRMHPANAGVHAMAAFAEHYQADAGARDLFLEHARFGAKFGYARPVSRAPERPRSGRRLRIAYLSGDFRDHSVAYFLMPILEAHDRSRFEIWCYASVTTEDDVTARFRALDLHFVNVDLLPNQALAEVIAADQIDVLIDLQGLTKSHRVRCLARRPAPLQITYLGYPDTTGCPAVDLRISDALADPPGEGDALNTERLLRLPVAWVFQPGVDVPIEPVDAARPLTFACFNVLPKVNDRVARTFAAVLAATPGSRLLLKTSLFRDEAARTRLVRGLLEQGLPSDRVEFAPWTRTRAEHLAYHRHVDIALDPFPYGGTTTTCDALWMGVPVVTREVPLHAGRVGKSLLTAVGLPDLVAESDEEYVEIARRLAHDVPRRWALRSSLRARVTAALGDGPAFTRGLEDALLEAWDERERAIASGARPAWPLAPIPLGERLVAVAPADPVSAVAFPLHEQGRAALRDEAALQVLEVRGVLLDASDDAGLTAIARASREGSCRLDMRTDEQAGLAEATARASGVADRVVLIRNTEAVPTSLRGIGLLRVAAALSGARRDLVESALAEGVPALVTCVGGGRASLEDLLSRSATSGWSFRPGLGVYSPVEPADLDEERPRVLLVPGGAPLPPHVHLVPPTPPPSCVSVWNRRFGARFGEVDEVDLGTSLVVAAASAEHALDTRLSWLERAATTTTSGAPLLSRAGACVALGRPSAAARSVEPLLAGGAVTGTFWPPLPGDDAPPEQATLSTYVEALAIEAFIKLSAPSSAQQADAVIPLLMRWHSLDGRDLEMCRRLGLLYARER